MATEIERKFLVRSNEYASLATERIEIRQAYLSSDPDATVRLRICGENAWLTVKSRNIGAARGEWEYKIPAADAVEMLQATGRPCLQKTRHII
ncbi:MAG: CYTH domain-containing protein, partial [Muribaculaceae bacterium]|nr:CYTH domain-containing protein [Muribaculaceae bacterium]